ncbi:MAG: CotH kinase family protein [Fibrobacter sp.]|nr:CotH kinase family protein [Fibrobacter sp.]
MALLSSVAVFAQEEPVVEAPFTIISQPAPISVVAKDKGVTLHFVAQKDSSDISYQWFKSVDGTLATGEALESATADSLETGSFEEKGVRYYFCVAKVGEDSLVSNVAAVAYTGLPVLTINSGTEIDSLNKEDWQKATLTLAGAEDESWDFEKMATSIRGRGNSTWEQLKKPFALKLDKKNEIMGMPKHKRWVLIANYLDNSFLKNHMAFFMSDKLKMDYTVRGKFVDVVYNGDYRGLYWLGEAIKVDKKRVNIDDGNDDITEDMDKDYLIEMDNHYDEIVKFTTPIRQMPYMVKNDDYMLNEEETDISAAGEARLQRFSAKIEKLEKLLYPDFVEGMNTNDCSAPDESYTKTIDLESWAKFWLINEIMDNTELNEPKSAYFTYESQKDLLKAGPAWDFDAGASTDNAPVKLDTSIYYNALFKSPMFVSALEKVWEEYKSKIDTTKINAEIDAMRNALIVAAKVDSLKWGVHLDLSEVERENYDAYVEFLKSSLDNKMGVVKDYIAALPQKQTVSPNLSLSAESFVYNGAANEPAVLITDEGNELVEGEDYVISYVDNIDAGTGKAIFNAIGNYAGWQEVTFTITPKPVTLIPDDVSKMYGESDPELTYMVEGLAMRDSVLDKVNDVELKREEGEDRGIYAITATVKAESNPNYIISTEDGEFSIEANTTEIVVTVNGLRDSVIFDGEKHELKGFNLESSLEAYSVDFVTYSGDSTVSGIDAAEYPMGLVATDFLNTSANYTNVVFEINDGKLTVMPKRVTLTVANAFKTYKEEDPEFTYSVEGLITIDSVEDQLNKVELSREEGENAGEYAITATVDADSNTNYAVHVENGVFTINPDTTKVVVTVTGHKDSLVYNSAEQSTTGFDIAASVEDYTIDMINFTGDSIAAGTNAGTYAMGLADSNFANASVNYTNVEFNVTDGQLKIAPKTITMKLDSLSKTYGSSDPVLTYTLEGTTDTLRNVTVKRDAGEDVGEYDVRASIEVYANPNFVVIVENSVFTVKPFSEKIVVSVVGHTDTVEYDTLKHHVQGYDISTNSSLYSLDFVNYKDYATVSGLEPGSYPMGLNADDFKNTSANFSNVVFEIVDGNLTIVKKEEEKPVDQPVVQPPVEENKDKDKDGLMAARAIPSTLKVVAMDRNIQVNSTLVGKAYAVFDMQGVVVRKGRVESASFEIPVSKAGVYMVRVGSLSQRVTVR